MVNNVSLGLPLRSVGVYSKPNSSYSDPNELEQCPYLFLRPEPGRYTEARTENFDIELVGPTQQEDLWDAFRPVARVGVSDRNGANRVRRRSLLNHHFLENHRTLLLPLCFRLALLVRCALARGNLVEGAPFRFHPNVGVAREHGA